MAFRQFRVRHHGQIVRIEIAREELPRALTVEMANEFTRIFKALGFSYVTLDLEGFRSGSMNAMLPIDALLKGLLLKTRLLTVLPGAGLSVADIRSFQI